MTRDTDSGLAHCGYWLKLGVLSSTLMLTIRVFDYALDAEFKARVRAANAFFYCFPSRLAVSTTFSNTKIYAAGGRYAGWIKDCEVDYVVLASNDFAVIASIILPVNNLDNDKCRVSSSRWWSVGRIAIEKPFTLATYIMMDGSMYQLYCYSRHIMYHTCRLWSCWRVGTRLYTKYTNLF